MDMVGHFVGEQVTATSPVTENAKLVVLRLEEAGKALLALPASGYTTAMRGSMPEIVRVMRESYGWEARPLRAACPGADDITRMDEAFGWLRFIPMDRAVLRRIVGLRALVHPVTDRHLYAWRKLGRTLGADYRAVQQWHAEAIGLIVTELHRRDFNFSA